ncbi:MAG: dihydrolipoamide acetyltransferase family protein, partial [Actinomycetota bacterium]
MPEADQPPAAAASPIDTWAGEREAAPSRLEPTEAEPRRGVLSPLVRRLAAEHGVDLAVVKGTGTGGRITKQDVLGATESRPPAASPKPPEPPQRPPSPQQPAAEVIAAPVAARIASTRGAGDEVVPITHIRKAIAEHMVSSHLETARAWNVVEVDMSRIWRLRQLAGPSFSEREGFSLTWMPFLAKAVTQALLTYPQVNSSWNGDGTTTLKHYVNLGIAVALERGLIVPVIHRADGMNLVGLSRAIRDVAKRAREKKLVPDDVASGTFTITNPGPFGSILSVPIINRGQTGILAFDGVTK